MNTFKKALIETLIIREGDYVNDPTDRGGKTKFGITEAVARDNDYNGDIEHLSYNVAFSIYEKRYWQPLKLDHIAAINQPLALQLFDFGVNSGVSTASKALQKTLNVLNRQGALYSDIKADGILGSKTLVALKQFIAVRHLEGVTLLAEIIRGQRISFCVDIAVNDPSQEKYQFGWLKRIVNLGDQT